MSKHVCAISPCSALAYFQCCVCEHWMCGTHTIRLPQWCQFYQDCCPECFEHLPEERKCVIDKEKNV